MNIEIKRTHHKGDLDFYNVCEDTKELGKFYINRKFFADYKELLINGSIVFKNVTVNIDVFESGEPNVHLQISSKSVRMLHYKDYIEQLDYAAQVANKVNRFLFEYEG
ncbi:MAG: hypothetical protein GY804_03865 [Alphaproteobacteria bacterium]|nr:hypothetical protein [Alphaproteobacteria bacterium]